MNIFISIIIWGALIQGLLLAILFISTKKYRSLANKLLGLFLIAFVLGALSDLLPMDKIGAYPISGYFTLPEVKVFFPVLFLHFVLEKLGRSSAYLTFLKMNYFLGLFIFSLTLVNLILFLFTDHSLLSIFGWGILDPFHLGHQYYAFALTILVFTIAIRETLAYRELVRNEYTDMSMLNINWLWQFIFVLTPIILFWGAEILRIALGGDGQSELTTIAYIFIAVLNYFVSYKAFTNQTLFEGSNASVTSAKPAAKKPLKPSGQLNRDICEQVIREMTSKKSYLNTNLTLHQLAKEVEIPARTISKCVNQELGLNFNEWVNSFRVEKALELIKSDTENLLSIEGIGVDSGFKSRSAMYAAFKKKLGHSPGYFKSK